MEECLSGTQAEMLLPKEHQSMWQEVGTVSQHPLSSVVSFNVCFVSSVSQEDSSECTLNSNGSDL